MTKASMADREPSMPDGDNVAQDEDENSRSWSRVGLSLVDDVVVHVFRSEVVVVLGP